MKKIFSLFIISFLFVISGNGQTNFVSNLTGNTGLKVSDGTTNVNRINAINTNTVSVTIFCYNWQSVHTGTITPTVPSYTTTPALTLICPPALYYPAEIYTAVINSPSTKIINGFSSGLYLRTVISGVGSYTTTADPLGVNSYTVAPRSGSVKVEINY